MGKASDALFDYASFLDRQIDAIRPGAILNLRSSYFPQVVGSSTLAAEIERKSWQGRRPMVNLERKSATAAACPLSLLS